MSQHHDSDAAAQVHHVPYDAGVCGVLHRMCIIHQDGTFPHRFVAPYRPKAPQIHPSYHLDPVQTGTVTRAQALFHVAHEELPNFCCTSTQVGFAYFHLSQGALMKTRCTAMLAVPAHALSCCLAVGEGICRPLFSLATRTLREVPVLRRPPWIYPVSRCNGQQVCTWYCPLAQTT